MRWEKITHRIGFGTSPDQGARTHGTGSSGAFAEGTGHCFGGKLRRIIEIDLYTPSLRVSMSKPEEIVILSRRLSAMWTVRSNASRTLRSSRSGRFSTRLLRRSMRFSAIPRAVEEEIVKTSSGVCVMLGWQRRLEWQ